MAKTHPGDCVDVDPFIPTGVCARCEGVKQDLTPPDDRPGAE